MSLFAIADTHLSFGVDKPMDIFGGWSDYTERLEKNWRAVVSEDDTVVIAGDISWAMKLSDAKADFAFLHSVSPLHVFVIMGNFTDKQFRRALCGRAGRGVRVRKFSPFPPKDRVYL